MEHLNHMPNIQEQDRGAQAMHCAREQGAHWVSIEHLLSSRCIFMSVRTIARQDSCTVQCSCLNFREIPAQRMSHQSSRPMQLWTLCTRRVGTLNLWRLSSSPFHVVPHQKVENIDMSKKSRHETLFEPHERIGQTGRNFEKFQRRVF